MDDLTRIKRQLQNTVRPDEIIALFGGIADALGQIKDAVSKDINEISERVAGVEDIAKQAVAIAEETQKIEVPGIPGRDGKDGKDGRDGKTVEIPVVKETIKTIETVREIPTVTEIKTETKVENPYDDGELITQIEELKKLVSEISARRTNVVAGQSGLHIYVDGSKKGLLNMVNYKAGTGVTLVHSKVNGLDTITFNSTSGTSTTSVIGEVVAFTGTAGTLAHTPSGSIALYRGSLRLQNTVDYTISGTAITLIMAASSGEVFLADYSF